MNNEKEKITLPDELQKKMFSFFLETSIPRKKKQLEEKARLLSDNQKTDRSGDNENDKNSENYNEDGDIC